MVVGKLLSVRIPVFLSMELSLCAALVAILPAQIARRGELRLLRRRELAYMFLQALFGIVLFRALTLYGLRLTSAVSAGVITSAAPAVMAVLAAAVLRERIGGTGIVGVCLAVAGLLLVNLWGQGAAGGAGYLAGEPPRAGRHALRGAAHRVSKILGRPHRLGDQHDGARRHERADGRFPLPSATCADSAWTGSRSVGWASVIYYGAVATNIAYILWGRGALRISATMTGLATAALPVTAVVLSALVLGEHLGLSTCWGPQPSSPEFSSGGGSGAHAGSRDGIATGRSTSPSSSCGR